MNVSTKTIKNINNYQAYQQIEAPVQGTRG